MPHKRAFRTSWLRVRDKIYRMQTSMVHFHTLGRGERTQYKQQQAGHVNSSHFFPTSESSSMINMPPTFRALSLRSGKASSSLICPLFLIQMDQNCLWLRSKTPNTNIQEPECGTVTQAHRSPKDKSKNMKLNTSLNTSGTHCKDSKEYSFKMGQQASTSSRDIFKKHTYAFICGYILSRVSLICSNMNQR